MDAAEIDGDSDYQPSSDIDTEVHLVVISALPTDCKTCNSEEYVFIATVLYNPVSVSILNRIQMLDTRDYKQSTDFANEILSRYYDDNDRTLQILRSKKAHFSFRQRLTQKFYEMGKHKSARCG